MEEVHEEARPPQQAASTELYSEYEPSQNLFLTNAAGLLPQQTVYIHDRTLERTQNDEEENEQRQGPFSDAVNSDGTLQEMFFGMVLGFLLSFTILFFWVRHTIHLSAICRFTLAAVSGPQQQYLAKI